MKITRLRLLGFKSFVESTEVPIEPGLTGVVGPNGCGKSNLLEALRWAMGETSHKSMRGSSMEDVIFAGSSERPARNLAEVTLFIDNQSRTAPAEFNDSEELEVTRRLERDEGSTYRVNGRESRARDIRLLFEDAATGARSPALVQQGRIGEIINSKPEERRRVLEDAAGIAGLHSRRHEAELRLKAAETNLERLHDVSGQLTTQLQSLKRQARQAQRYKEVAEKLREAEALRQYLAWASACTQVEQDEAALTEALKLLGRETQAESAGLRAQVEASEKMPALREEEATRGAVLQRLAVERDRLDREEARAKERLAELDRRLAQLTGDRRREETLAVEAVETLARLEQEAATLAASDTDEDQRPALQATVDAAKVALGETETALERIMQSAAEQRARRGQLTHTIEELERRRSALSSEADRVNAELAGIAAKLGESQDVEALQADVDRLAAMRSEADDKITSADEAERTARIAETTRREHANAMTLRARQLETEVATLTKLLRPSEGSTWRAIVEDVRVQPGYEAAFGAALGDDLDAADDAAAPAHWTVTDGVGDLPLPGGAAPLADIVAGPPALARTLAQIGLVDAERGRELQAMLRSGQRLVSRAGDLWRWDGYTAAAEALTPAAVRLVERNRLDRLTAQSEAAKTEAAEIEAMLAGAKLAAEQAGETTQAARMTARNAASAVSEAREKLQKAEHAAQETSKRSAALIEARNRLEGNLADVKRQGDEAGQALAALLPLADLDAELNRERTTAAECRTRFVDAKAAFDTIERERRRREERREAVTSEIARWRKRQEGAAAQIAEIETRRTELEAERKAVADVPGTYASAREKLADEIGVAERQRRAAADALAEAETALRAANMSVRDAGQRLAAARESRARCEARLEAARNRRAEQSKSIQDAFDCPPEACLACAKLQPGAALPPLADVDERILKFRTDRDRLGSVNLRAEEEANEIEAQVDALEQEGLDLTEAIAKLRGGIGGINREGRKRLLDAFEVVNGHFKRLFEVLFGGGAAELKLIESDDPLESGLEIYARPPGKRTQVLTLLSGGEKALTALALIFAVFLTNPSPICVLDEVDAPLDDSNVDRFCNLMDEMAKTTDTRFLIITHHPLTMARMHRLFGVTMAERGVSQLVSVDLQTAERYLETG